MRSLSRRSTKYLTSARLQKIKISWLSPRQNFIAPTTKFRALIRTSRFTRFSKNYRLGNLREIRCSSAVLVKNIGLGLISKEHKRLGYSIPNWLADLLLVKCSWWDTIKWSQKRNHRILNQKWTSSQNSYLKAAINPEFLGMYLHKERNQRSAA